jgi:hypothetical protein
MGSSVSHLSLGLPRTAWAEGKQRSPARPSCFSRDRMTSVRLHPPFPGRRTLPGIVPKGRMDPGSSR